jgi:hypothetical protein
MQYEEMRVKAETACAIYFAALFWCALASRVPVRFPLTTQASSLACCNRYVHLLFRILTLTLICDEMQDCASVCNFTTMSGALH